MRACRGTLIYSLGVTRGTARVSSRFVRPFWLSTIVAAGLISRKLDASRVGDDPTRTTGEADLATTGKNERPTVDITLLANSMSNEFKWWFPSSLATATAVTVLLVYIAERYYTGFYTAFGMDPVQAGVTRGDVIFRILPITVGLALFLLVCRAAYLFRRLTKTRPKRAMSRTKKILRETSPALIVLLALLLVFGVAEWAGYARHAGTLDAREVITSNENFVYSSLWQEELGTKTLVATIRWVGPPEVDQFTSKPTTSEVEHFTLGRVVSQVDETTVYFDLFDCRVYSLPTIDLDLTYKPTSFHSGSKPSIIEGISSCKSDIT